MKAAQTAQAPVVGDASRSSPGNPGAGAGCGPRGGARAQPQPPVSPARSNLEGASRLELNMSREDVRRVLGPPERTEGCRVGGRAVIVWYYLLEGPQGGRVLTLPVFEKGRLGGWGENYYRRRLRKVSGP